MIALHRIIFICIVLSFYTNRTFSASASMLVSKANSSNFDCSSNPDAPKKRWKFGINAGLNISAFSDQIFKKPDTRLSHFLIPKVLHGFDTGIEIQYNFNPHISANSGINYRQKGMQYESNDVFRKVNYRANYLTFPLHFRYTRNSFFGELGAEMASLNSTATIIDGTRKNDDSIFKNSFDTLLNAGFGMTMGKHFALSVRLSKGLIGTANVIETDNEETIKYNKNISLQTGLTYYFN